MTLGDNGTDGQTDRVRRNIYMRPPPREEGRIIKGRLQRTVLEATPVDVA